MVQLVESALMSALHGSFIYVIRLTRDYFKFRLEFCWQPLAVYNCFFTYNTLTPAICDLNALYFWIFKIFISKTIHLFLKRFLYLHNVENNLTFFPKSNTLYKSSILTLILFNIHGRKKWD